MTLHAKDRSAEWAQRLAAYDRPLRRTKRGLLIAAAVAVAIGLAVNGIVLFAAFACLGGFVLAHVAALATERVELRCPECGGDPAEPFTPRSPFDVDACRHCHVWLRRPW